MWTHHFQNKHARVCLKDIPWKRHRNGFDYSIKWASEAQTFRNHHHLASSHRTEWKQLVFISERISCMHVWRTPFSVVPIHRTVHHKNESWTDGNSLSRKIQMCSCVKCTRVSGNSSLMLSIQSKTNTDENRTEMCGTSHIPLSRPWTDISLSVSKTACPWKEKKQNIYLLTHLYTQLTIKWLVLIYSEAIKRIQF